jgi:hypothetical protein
VPDQSTWVAGAGDNVSPRPTGFAGAIEIIDSDSLQVVLDAGPREQVDERAYLRARLTDMFLNDWDRHPGNWKWARLKPGGPWEPVSRDRDKVLVSYGGVAALSGKCAGAGEVQRDVPVDALAHHSQSRSRSPAS